MFVCWLAGLSIHHSGFKAESSLAVPQTGSARLHKDTLLSISSLKKRTCQESKSCTCTICTDVFIILITGFLYFSSNTIVLNRLLWSHVPKLYLTDSSPQEKSTVGWMALKRGQSLSLSFEVVHCENRNDTMQCFLLINSTVAVQQI